jgi:hypothetical protein
MTPAGGRLAPEEEASERCAVAGCGGEAARHLSLIEARKVFTSLPERGRRAPLCRAHYKEWKKRTKEARKLDRLTW